jgi:iron complex transport system substrate-binding protein
MFSVFRAHVLCLALLLSTLPAASAAHAQVLTGFPMTITDDSSVATTFAAPPRRVVSLNPGLTEITFDVLAGDRLVAVDSFSNYPDAAKGIQPRLTTYPTVSVETIVSLQPDLVLTLAERDNDIAQLRAQGIPVLKLLPRDYDATASTVRLLGALYGNPDAGDSLASDMLTRRDAVASAVAGAPRPRVYEELDASDPDKPYVAGPNGFYGQLLDVAGGDNVFADLPSDFGQVGAESVIARDPEVIILTDTDLPFSPQSPELVAARPGWNTVTAVQNGAIYAVSADLYSTPGPRLANGLEQLARVLHPDRFAGPAPNVARMPQLALAMSR